MIKVIGGTYRSRNLQTPPEEITLPTKNMVRGAMVSSLGEAISGARVLDLFAGSGALGIESLSRGASSCVFVDASRVAAKVVQDNLASLKESKGEVLNLDYQTALNRLKEEGRVFDIVFLDPPYAKKEAYQTSVSYLLDHGMLSPSAILILEYEGEIEIDRTPFAGAREYKYGKSKVLALRRSL